MTKQEIIEKLRGMAKFPTVTLPRDSEALRNAADLLEQQEQGEPVACVGPWHYARLTLIPRYIHQTFEHNQPLYTTPPQRTWVGLTDEERDEVWKTHVLPSFHDRQKFYSPTVYAQLIEDKLRSRNT
jgi:hypothetical protein